MKTKCGKCGKEWDCEHDYGIPGTNIQSNHCVKCQSCFPESLCVRCEDCKDSMVPFNPPPSS